MQSYSWKNETCPWCGSKGSCVFHDTYTRSITDFVHGKTIYGEAFVIRLRCTGCGHTHAILPDVIIPYSVYGLFFILRVLAEYFLHLHMSMENNAKQLSNAAAIAQFKLAVIAPAIHGLYPDASRNAYYKRITKQPLTLPDGSVVCYKMKLQLTRMEPHLPGRLPDGILGLLFGLQPV